MATSTGEIDRDTYPHLSAFRSVLRERYGFFKDVVDRGGATFGPTWATDFDETLGVLFGSSTSLEAAAKGYARFVLDLLRRQQRFAVERVYPSKTYAEAAQEVYHDERYMLEEYLPGLVLSHFLWPHHYRQMRYFESAFIADMERTGAASFSEVGIGTGLYSRSLLRRLPGVLGTGYDISAASISFTREHMRGFGLDDRYELVLQDIVASEMRPTAWLVCVEVLEHLEDPVDFLRVLRAALLPGGRAFITAALNAPHADHIYLYEQPEQVVDQFRLAGFDVDEYFVGPAGPPAAPDAPVASVAAYIVR